MFSKSLLRVNSARRVQHDHFKRLTKKSIYGRLLSDSNKPTLLTSASEYYSSLRWRLANSLTSSLSEDEKVELLKRIDVPQDEESAADEMEEDTDVNHSIGEAVAAARAEERKLQMATWEKEKDKIYEEAERAANARVENELLIQQRRIAFEKWQSEVENESSEVQEQVTMEEHPVLGSALLDMGYKRVHVASVQTLKSLPVWNKQRTYRHTRANTMAKDKLKTLHLGLPGVITVHEALDGKLSIIDGQHRVGMLSILEESAQGANGMDLENVLIEVYPQKHNDKLHADQLFVEINKAEPVKLLDMPGVASQAVRNIINEGAAKMEQKFPKMFSPSQRCRVPHVNVDNLRDAIFASNVLQRRNIKSPKALEEWMLEQNEALKQKYLNDDDVRSQAQPKALSKAIDNDFFLGMESNWMQT